MKRLLIGASGFLGKEIFNTLNSVPDTLGRQSNCTYKFDFSSPKKIFMPFYDQVIHCAGLAHKVAKSKEQAKLFFQINFEGTKALLDSLANKPPKQFMLICTVAVYGLERGLDINESHALAAMDPYGQSKLLAEEYCAKWASEHGVKLLILRLPLIAGKSPPGNLGKMISGIKSGKYLSIAGGRAKRSVVLAEDVAELIARSFGKSGIFNLTDGYHPSFREIEECICKQLNQPLPRKISSPFAKILGKAGDILPFLPVNSSTISKMTNDLTFDDSKARQELGWNPRKVIEHFKIQ